MTTLHTHVECPECKGMGTQHLFGEATPEPVTIPCVACGASGKVMLPNSTIAQGMSCPCQAWAREASDSLPAHHPYCPKGDVRPQYQAILQVRDDTTRRLLLMQFVEKHFPAAFNVITKGTE